jgi:hypothetical protein
MTAYQVKKDRSDRPAFSIRFVTPLPSITSVNPCKSELLSKCITKCAKGCSNEERFSVESSLEPLDSFIGFFVTLISL